MLDQSTVLAKNMMNFVEEEVAVPERPKINFWVKLYAPPDNKPYWYNKLTKEVTWKKPEQIREEERAFAEFARAEKVIALRDIEGSDGWSIAVTNWKQYFYYNDASRISQWQVPSPQVEQLLLEIKARDDVAMPGRSELEHDRIENESDKFDHEDEQEDEDEFLEETTQHEEDEVEYQLRMLEAEGELQQDELAILEDIKGPSDADRVKLFKELLREKDVDAFGLWERDVIKIVDDERFRLIQTPQQRIDLFNEYCKEAATSAVSEKKSFKDYFTELLESEVTSSKMRWEEFCRRFKKDSRFLNFNAKHRESAFRAHLLSLKQRKAAKKH